VGENSLLDDQNAKVRFGAGLSTEEGCEGHLGNNHGSLLPVRGLSEKGASLRGKERNVRTEALLLGENLVKLREDNHNLLEAVLAAEVATLLHIGPGRHAGGGLDDVTKVLVNTELRRLQTTWLLLEGLRERGSESGGGEEGHVVVGLTSPLPVLLSGNVGLRQFFIDLPFR